MNTILIVVGCIALGWTLAAYPVSVLLGRRMHDPDEDQDVTEYVRVMNEVWKERA
jgi:hypothetical protein